MGSVTSRWYQCTSEQPTEGLSKYWLARRSVVLVVTHSSMQVSATSSRCSCKSPCTVLVVIVLCDVLFRPDDFKPADADSSPIATCIPSVLFTVPRIEISVPTWGRTPVLTSNASPADPADGAAVQRSTGESTGYLPTSDNYTSPAAGTTSYLSVRRC